MGDTGEWRGRWVRWDTLVSECGGFVTETPSVCTLPLVQTLDTARTEYMMDILARHGKHVMLVGDRGSAKSLLVHHYLSDRSCDDAHFCSKTIVFSSATTSATLQVRD